MNFFQNLLLLSLHRNKSAAISKVKAIQLMAKWVFLLNVFMIFCAPRESLRQQENNQEAVRSLRNQITHILQDPILRQTKTGLKIVSLETAEVLYEQNSQLLFHPASNMKLLTTAAALRYLGPDYRFKTTLYADTSAVLDSMIHGNLYLKGFGNPDLISLDLRSMAEKLKFRGIKQIQGNLICDDSFFDELSYGSGWMWDDASSSDFAPISALSVNDNCVTITVKPGRQTGDTLLATVDPPTTYMKLENRGVTVDSSDTTAIEEFKIERKWKSRENVVTVEGGLTAEDSPQSEVIEVVNATLYTGSLFNHILNDIGISIDGQVVEGEIPDTSVVLVKHYSEPLTFTVYNTNKISDNLSAELILKTLGAEIGNPPGSAEKGISLIYRFLDSLGVDSSSYKLADGSGVSRYNVITPDLIVSLLEGMHRDFQIEAEFKTSLPIAGVDGTLRNRMKESAAEAKLRAKTGTLSGVSALAGYTTTDDNEILAFSIIMEHFVEKTSKIREIQDRIGALISSFSRRKISKKN